MVGVREGSQLLRRGGTVFGLRWRNRAGHDVRLAGGDPIKRCGADSERLGNHVSRQVSDPISAAEGGVLGKVTVVEDENEVRVDVACVLNGVRVAAREEKDVAGTSVRDIEPAFRVEQGDANT